MSSLTDTRLRATGAAATTGHELSAPTRAIAGDVIRPDSLSELAAEVALGQGAPLTRTTYASVYRAFCAFAGPHVGPEALTRAHVRAYREALEHAGRSPATIAKHLSALRTHS